MKWGFDRGGLLISYFFRPLKHLENRFLLSQRFYLNRVCLSDFEIISEVGSGATGTVYKCRLKSGMPIFSNLDKTNEIIAIKRKKIGKKSKDILKEVFMLKNIDHPNIIK